MRWHGVDFCIQLFLDFDHVLLVSFGNEVDSQTDLSEPAGTSNSVQIGAAFWREVEVDDNVDGLNVDTSGNEIWTD